MYAKADIPNNAAEFACPDLFSVRMNDMDKLQGNNVYHDGLRHVDCRWYVAHRLVRITTMPFY